MNLCFLFCLSILHNLLFELFYIRFFWFYSRRQVYFRFLVVNVLFQILMYNRKSSINENRPSPFNQTALLITTLLFRIYPAIEK